jgi:hypothetical protein
MNTGVQRADEREVAPVVASPARDVQLEARFLADAAGGGGCFAEHATARLVLGQVLYGDSWATRGAGALVDEAAEEAVDLACWAVLAAQAGVPPRAGALLALAARHSARAHQALAAAAVALRAEESGCP